MQRQSFKRARIGFVKPIFIVAYGGGFIPLLKSQVIISVIILTELNNSFKLKLEDKLLLVISIHVLPLVERTKLFFIRKSQRHYISTYLRIDKSLD